MKVQIGLAIFLVAVGASTALKCYVCAGSSRGDCARGRKSAMVEQACQNFSEVSSFNSSEESSSESNSSEEANVQSVCLQFYTPTHYSPKLFVRGCGATPGDNDPCEYLAKFIRVEGCKSCRTDLCNKYQRPAKDSDFEHTNRQ